jgi:hypothetical protein
VQDLAGMDVLCTDKTGTLTAGAPRLACWIGPDGLESAAVLDHALLSAVSSVIPLAQNRYVANAMSFAAGNDAHVCTLRLASFPVLGRERQIAVRVASPREAPRSLPALALLSGGALMPEANFYAQPDGRQPPPAVVTAIKRSTRPPSSAAPTPWPGR